MTTAILAPPEPSDGHASPNHAQLPHCSSSAAATAPPSPLQQPVIQAADQPETLAFRDRRIAARVQRLVHVAHQSTQQQQPAEIILIEQLLPHSLGCWLTTRPPANASCRPKSRANRGADSVTLVDHAGAFPSRSQPFRIRSVHGDVAAARCGRIYSWSAMRSDVFVWP